MNYKRGEPIQYLYDGSIWLDGIYMHPFASGANHHILDCSGLAAIAHDSCLTRAVPVHKHSIFNMQDLLGDKDIDWDAMRRWAKASDERAAASKPVTVQVHEAEMQRQMAKHQEYLIAQDGNKPCGESFESLLTSLTEAE